MATMGVCLCGAFAVANLGGGFVTIHFGHLTIHQHQVIRNAAQSFKRLPAVGHCVGAIAQLLQLPHRHLLIHDVIFGQQNELAGDPLLRLQGGCADKFCSCNFEGVRWWRCCNDAHQTIEQL